MSPGPAGRRAVPSPGGADEYQRLVQNDLGAVIHPASVSAQAILIEWPNGMRIGLYTADDHTVAVVKYDGVEIELHTD